jgi:hypothetical protein
MLDDFNQATTADQARGRNFAIPLVVDKLKKREDQHIR